MYKELLPLLRCPKCGSELRVEASTVNDGEVIEGFLVCDKEHRFFIREGVADFCSSEQGMANRWSESYKNADYEAYDRQVEEMKTELERQQQGMLIDQFAGELSEMKDGVVVDIASGRGMLIAGLASRISDTVNLIATDLSFEVLMYDRLKLKKINPSLRVNYLACDATAMPLIDGCADATVSFYGIANMLGIVDQGIMEAARIAKPGGKLLNASMLVKETSKGIDLVRRICAENDIHGAEGIYLQNTATELHERYFEGVYCDIICEAVKDESENETDLLPYPNEWYAQVIFRCKKRS